MKKISLGLLLFVPLSLRAYDNISLVKTVSFEKLVKEPSGAVVAKSGEVLISDEGQDRIAVFSAQGKWESNWGGKGKGDGQYSGPRGLAADEDGFVYVADAGNNRVQVFSPEGKFARSIGAKGSGPGQLSGPSAVAVSSDGFLFVADAGNNRVQIFSREGIYFHGFSSLGDEKNQLKDPADVKISAAGVVFVLDRGNNRVQKFSPGGRYLGSLGTPGTSGKEQDALPQPVALGIDGFGYVYVADGKQNKVKEFGPNGEFVGTFGTWGAGPGQFKEISGLAVSREGDVVVLDRSNRRAQVFHVESSVKVQRQSPVPVLRVRAAALPSLAFDFDDIVFSGETLVGVSRKNNQVVLAGNYGKAAPVVLGGKGKDAQKVNDPLGVAVSSGVLFVADGGNRRVLLWDEKGGAVPPGQIGGSGKREGQFKLPQATALDPQGRLYVVDSELARCQVFNKDGIFLYSIGTEGESSGRFKRPVDVAALSDKLAVIDADRKALLFFDAKGKFLTEAAGQLANPVSLAVDPAGRGPFLFVLDAGSGQVKVFKDNAQFVAAFGSLALFPSARSAAMDGTGRLWVADAGTLKVFDVQLVPAAPADLKAVSGEGAITLKWAPDSEKLALDYAVYKSTYTEGKMPLYETVSSTSVPVVDEEIVPGLTYYYAVSARARSTAGKDRLEGPRAYAKTSTSRPANLPSLDITSLSLENIFSAQYKYYVEHPIGKAVVKNNTEKTFQKIRVGFLIQDFMDYPTETPVEKLNPGAPWSLELKGVFNNKILSVNEDTPIQAQITVTYYEDGAEKTFKRTQPFTLYSRYAMSWEDPRRIATFVTPKDPPVLEFTRSIEKSFQEEIDNSPVNKAVLQAQVMFHALGVHGLSYLKDPNNPFEKAVQNAKAVDYVQYPRETLKRKTGDCDDLVNLYASGLENLTIPTAFIDLPGHILVMFQAEPSAEPLGFPPDLVVEYKDAQWIPVEVTMLGKTFEEAWREGAKEYRQAAAENKAHIIDVHEAWQTYQPATLPEEAPLPAPTKDDLLKKFPGEMEKLADLRLNRLAEPLKAKLQENPKEEEAHLQLGLLYAQHQKFKESGEWFDKLLELNPKHAAALNNRGNVCFIQGDAVKARELYRKAVAEDSKDSGLLLNLARVSWQAGDKTDAEKSFQQALALRPELKKDFKSIEDFVK